LAIILYVDTKQDGEFSRSIAQQGFTGHSKGGFIHSKAKGGSREIPHPKITIVFG